MPSLPELEVYRRRLMPELSGRAITAVEPLDYRVVRAPREDLERVLVGHQVDAIGRYGKWLWLDTDEPQQTIFHLGLTGRLDWLEESEPQPKYAALAVHFDNAHRLVLADQRHLGKIYVRPFTDLQLEKQLGPDALDVTEDYFVNTLGRKRRGARDVLGDQKIMAGLGGKYSDEILWQARLHPNTKLDRLPEADMRRLYQIMRTVVHTAIERDADVEHFPADWLIPHRKTDKLCPRGHGPLTERSLGGSATLYCSVCQPAPNPYRRG
jgi:formamidopyrimidine-DNA glycosylase